MANIKVHSADRLAQLWHERIDAKSVDDLLVKLSHSGLGPLPWHFASAKGDGKSADVVILALDSYQSDERPDMPFMVAKAMGYLPIMGHAEPKDGDSYYPLGVIKSAAFDANTAQSEPGQGEAASEAADEAEREIEG